MLTMAPNSSFFFFFFKAVYSDSEIREQLSGELVLEVNIQYYCSFICSYVHGQHGWQQQPYWGPDNLSQGLVITMD